MLLELLIKPIRHDGDFNGQGWPWMSSTLLDDEFSGTTSRLDGFHQLLRVRKRNYFIRVTVNEQEWDGRFLHLIEW